MSTSIERRAVRMRERPDPLERVSTRDDADDIEKAAAAGVFGYAAGKSIIAKRLVKLFPVHKVYTELFCGSAALYFTKDAVETEVLNDRDEEVAGALKAIQALSKSEVAKLATMNWKSSPSTFAKVKASSPTDRVGKLYKFLYIMRFSYGKNRSSYSPSEGQDAHRVVKTIEARQPRMKGTKILNGDYSKPLKDYDGSGAFHFLDPPYKGHNANARVGEKDFDEDRFRKDLEGIKGRFLVTYGVKGNLDTSGFEVKRMRQRRTIGAAKGAPKDAFLTHLLVSNFKIAQKSLGGGIELDDVMGIVDVGPGEDRLLLTGSRTSVVVPDQIHARAWKNDDPMLCYQERPGPTQGIAQVRFDGAVCKLDLAIPVGESIVGWTFDVQRAPAVGEPADVAKNFSTKGSRFFHALDGAGAEPMKESSATAVALIDRPSVELGLQTPDLHEYILTKSDVFEGVLRVERDESLGAKYPWIATYCDRYPMAFYDFPVLKADAPMPPEGVSALPASLERAVPAELRFWEMRGTEAVAAREALAVSKLLAPEGLAFVDGELCRVETQLALVEAPVRLDGPLDWTVRKAVELAANDLVEVFSPAQLAKADGAPVFIDAGDVEDGMIEPFVKALSARPGDYVVCASDSPAARLGLSKLGEVFRFRPGEDAPVEATKRVFVTSFAFDRDVERLFKGGPRDVVRMLEEIGPPIEWSGAVAGLLGSDVRGRMKAAWDAMSPTEKKRVHAKFLANFDKNWPVGKAEWSTAYVNDLPDSAFLFIEAGGEKDEQGKTKPRSLRHFPVRDKDGAVDPAHAKNAIGRIPQSDAAGLDASKKEALQDKARRLFAEATKAIFSTPPGPKEREDEAREGKPKLFTPSDDTRDIGKLDLSKLTDEQKRALALAIQADQQRTGFGRAKADFNEPDNGIGPGFLRPAQGQDGDPYRKRPRYGKVGKIVEQLVEESREIKIAKGDDEHVVYGIVLEPDTVDAQNDVYSSEEVRQAAHKYMEDFQNTGYMHRKHINEKAKVIESYLAPCDFNAGGQKVKKGTWCMAMRVLDPTLWSACKDGGLTGFSIGGSAQRVPEETSKAMRKTEHQGIPVTIDRPKGYVQHGRGEDGKTWEREYKLDYGYIPRTKGGDGEGIDVFLGPKENAPVSYWIAQKKNDGSFDEWKVMLGFDSPEAAKKAYVDHIPEKFFGEMHAVPVSQMKGLLNKEPEHKMQPEGPP